MTPQLRFVAACSYWPTSAAGLAWQREQLQTAPTRVLDPASLLALIQRHRIVCLAQHVLSHHGFEHLQGDEWPGFQTRAKQACLRNLALFSEYRNVSALLLAANIAHRCFKGPPLSQKLYNDPSLRHSNDVDLLVRPEQIPECAGFLCANGWQLKGAGIWAKGGIYRIIAEHHRYHIEFVHERRGTRIELHWRLERIRCPKFDAQWWAFSESSSADFAYLCMHGAKHAWSRLKWPGDIAAILDRNPLIVQEAEPIFSALQLTRQAAQAILLNKLIFNIAPVPGAAKLIARHPEAEGLAAFAIEEMKRAAEPYADRSWREMWQLYRYFAKVQKRYPLRNRIQWLLDLCLVPQDQTHFEHPASPILMPFTRALHLARKYF